MTTQRARHPEGNSDLGSTWAAADPYDASQELKQVDSRVTLKVFQHTQVDIFSGALT